jgi:hypothetical protein
MPEESNCCSTTEDGSMVCLMPENGEKPSCQTNLIQAIPIIKEERGEKVRSAIAFTVACITSPCCTPLIVPVLISLAAGSPFALWLGANLGWVYGGLTLVSLLSFVLALRWMNKRKPKKNKLVSISSIRINEGEKAHG